MSIDNEETLYAYMCNYNWDDGFEIPSIALKNKHCKLATALMIYYGASGVEMLVEKDMRKEVVSSDGYKVIEFYEKYQPIDVPMLPCYLSLLDIDSMIEILMVSREST